MYTCKSDIIQPWCKARFILFYYSTSNCLQLILFSATCWETIIFLVGTTRHLRSQCSYIYQSIALLYSLSGNFTLMNDSYVHFSSEVHFMILVQLRFDIITVYAFYNIACFVWEIDTGVSTILVYTKTQTTLTNKTNQTLSSSSYLRQCKLVL